jgi:hypothetical protein
MHYLTSIKVAIYHIGLSKMKPYKKNINKIKCRGYLLPKKPQKLSTLKNNNKIKKIII